MSVAGHFVHLQIDGNLGGGHPLKKLWWIGLAALLLSGCGEISYKRGASPADLESARKTCRASGDEKSVDKCLEEQGWVIRKPDDMDLFATIVPSNDARLPAADPAKPFAVPAPAGAVILPGAAAPAQAKPPGSEPVAAAPKPPPGPMDLYTVASWWKIGAGREALEADMGACVKDLGEAHQPNAKTQQVTRGLVICLHDKGWKALLQG